MLLFDLKPFLVPFESRANTNDSRVISLTLLQDRRRPILRSAPAAPRHCIPLHQSLRLFLRRGYSLQWICSPAQGRPGRLWRRSRHDAAQRGLQ
jgi:hypothetical protein